VKKKPKDETEPPTTSPSSCGSEANCSRCGKPREIGDSCRTCYLLVSQQMAETVRGEPHKITILTNNQEDIQ